MKRLTNDSTFSANRPLFNGHLKRNKLPISSLFGCKGRSNYSRSLHRQHNDFNKKRIGIYAKSEKKKNSKKEVKKRVLQIYRWFCAIPWLAKSTLKIGVFHMLYYFSYLGHFVVLRKQMIGCKQAASIISSVCKKIKIL